MLLNLTDILALQQEKGYALQDIIARMHGQIFASKSFDEVL